MDHKKLLSISIIILAVSILLGTFWIGFSLNRISEAQLNNTQVSTDKGLLTEAESAEYLSISLEEFHDILTKDIRIQEGQTVYQTYEFLPYMKINGKIMFSKEELNEWIKFHTQGRLIG